MKPLILFTAVLLVVPMVFLNQLGRPAFIGFYLGVIATWLAIVIAARSDSFTGRHRGLS